MRTTRSSASSEAVFLSLFAGSGADAFWLDSARTAYGMGRYSIMGALDGECDDRIVYSARERTIARGDGVVIDRDVDLWDWIAYRIERNPSAPLPVDIPFAGGYVGYAGYGTPGPGCAPRVDPRDRDAEFLHITRFIVIDHETGETHVVAVAPPDGVDDARRWVELTSSRLEAVRPARPPDPPSARGVVAASVDTRGYLDDLARVERWLLDGESYEACYTYSLSFETTEEPIACYRRMRADNPAPYAAFLRFGDRHVLSCSPERYLHVDRTGWAEARPIKGTARRVPDAELDRRVAAELAQDPKSRSENLMIVDLLRNDLGRICLPGTVTVPRLMAVESYATVHQLVTSVRGRLRQRPAAAVRAVQALFPGGSMTGAPKIRTVAMLDALERSPRGVYAGILGYFSRCGAADFSIVIRTAVIDDATVSIGTGGAITVQSDPWAELEETVVKSGAVLAAFGHDHPAAQQRM